MTKILEHTNAKCIKCGVVEEVMRRIGFFVMCETCTNEIFPDGVKDREIYLKWLNVYNETY